MKNYVFVAEAAKLIGEPYSKCDCAAVIRLPLAIKFSGTNWLFRSINNSPKYRYLTELHQCGDGITPPPGAVAFKTKNVIPHGYDDKPDAYHCGVVDTDGFIIHSSPSTGVRKDETSYWDNWDYWGLLKHVEYDDNDSIHSGGSVGGINHAVNAEFSSQLKEMTDRELLEAIYNAVVRD